MQFQSIIALVYMAKELWVAAPILCVLYYLGWARHQDDFNHPGYTLEDLIIDLENQ